MALGLLFAGGAHFAVGKFGWFARFGAVRVGVAEAIGLVSSSVLYLRSLFVSPLGSNNVFEQQFQMHRLLRDHYPVPVAVNDLGWVSYRNDQYVLDLWGLGSQTALEARLQHPESTAWMQELAREHQVKLVMVYDAWSKSLPSWERVGELSLGKMRITPAHRDVAFYLTKQGDRAEFCRAVQGLPEGVEFRSTCED